MIVEKITTRQMMLYIMATRVSISISVLPAINLPPYNHDIWIMVMLSITHTFIVMIPLLYLANKFTEYSVIGYMKKIFGKSIGKILGILYVLYFIMLSINGITIQSELVATSFLVDTSNIVIIGVMVITCIYLVTRGIKNILTASEILIPIALFIITLLVLLGLVKVDYSILLPILKYSSFKDMNLGAIQLTFFYTDIFLLTMIVPELENKEDINKIFFITTVLSLLFSAIIIVVVFGSLGVEQSRHSNFAFLLYTRSLKDIKILERIDPVFVIAWLITNFMRLTGFLYLATRVLREIFNKDEKDKIIVFIVGGISAVVSMLILNERSVIGIRKQFDLFYGILFVIFVIAIPVLTCIVYFFRRKSLNK
ncbi:GerAB/ArcD/ProY family transporter [Tissierella creatinophila]|uniref:Spore germination protein YndE n=1 Tax=Tissierella creatinophila DSM 6911 TaxID=1123403 RepID=A0A1U7M8I3_TISCR|nr:endospore germination permease [Tissierella creatinophila]OLS03607.1 spore germination protein YndE [Tissierella creatinophila DSM 6911]